MSDPVNKNATGDGIEQQAAAWVLRCDRGLTAAEHDELSQWLATDAQHGDTLRRYRQRWNRLDQLGRWRPEHSSQPNPDLLAPSLRRRILRFLPVSLSLTAVAVAIFALSVWYRGEIRSTSKAAPTVVEAFESRKELEDGSVIELNRGAAVTTQFSTSERRVRLDHGEAHFTVTKNPSRPFVVVANGIDICAVGTAFNVRLDASVVEVLVTEGQVRLKSPGAAHQHAAASQQTVPALVPVLEARQRIVISHSRAMDAPQIATLTRGEIERVLAWQHRLLDFTSTPLSDIIAEFNRRNVVQITLMDPALSSIRTGAAFRSDNIDGFVRLLETGFDVRSVYRGETEILLYKEGRSILRQAMPRSR